MNFLQFFFSSFWIWLGFTFLVCCVLKYAVDLVKAIRAKRKVQMFKKDGMWQMSIENASLDDVEATLVRQELRETMEAQRKEKQSDD